MCERNLLQVGDKLTPFHSPTITQEWLQTYAEVSGDDSPIHLDPMAAKNAGFPQPAAHGMLSMGLAAQVISPYLSKETWIEQIQARFHAPLLVGDQLTIKGTVTHKDQSIIGIQIEGHNQMKETILSANARLRADRLRKERGQ